MTIILMMQLILLIVVILQAYCQDIITTVAGSSTSGSFSGDGGQATSAALAYPCGIALDSAGNLYIADYYNDRIRKVTVSTGIITTYAGTGTRSYSGDNGPATSAALAYPQGVATDSEGTLFVCIITY